MGHRADRNCVDCEYSMLITMLKDGIWHACDYLGRVGKCRPCEPGDDCTVKIKAEKKKRPNLHFPLQNPSPYFQKTAGGLKKCIQQSSND